MRWIAVLCLLLAGCAGQRQWKVEVKPLSQEVTITIQGSLP